MKDKTIRCVKVVTNNVADARRQLNSCYPGIAVEGGTDGSFQMDLKSDYLDGVVTHRLATQTGVKFRLSERSDAYMLAALDKGGLNIEVSGRWHERRGLSFIMVDATLVSCWHWHPGEYEIVLIDANRLHARLSQWIEWPVAQRIRFDLHAPADATAIRMAREIVRVARMSCASEGRQPGAGPEVLRHLRDAMMRTLLEAIPHNYSTYLTRRRPGILPKHIRRATDYIHSHARTPVRLSDIAKASHVSLRGLQVGFARFHGISPMAYLRQVRLAGAYADLCAAEDTRSVGDIAKRWQFSHLGLFAQTFRKSFGFLPSDVRRSVGLSEPPVPRHSEAVAPRVAKGDDAESRTDKKYGDGSDRDGSETDETGGEDERSES